MKGAAAMYVVAMAWRQSKWRENRRNVAKRMAMKEGGININQ